MYGVMSQATKVKHSQPARPPHHGVALGSQSSDALGLRSLGSLGADTLGLWLVVAVANELASQIEFRHLAPHQARLLQHRYGDSR